MAQLMISKSKPLKGRIKISGAKNASLPLMAACLLTDKPVKLYNVPQISDVDRMKEELRSYGIKVDGRGTEVSPLVLNARDAVSRFWPGTGPVERIRGHVFTWGPLVARFGEAEVRPAGGCEIGGKKGRPVNFHSKALQKMGAEKTRPRNPNSLSFKAENSLRGASIDFLTDDFPQVSVGATENIVMAATLAKGTTTITNAAMEPEVLDLAKMLIDMGANIQVNQSGRVITIVGRAGQLLSGTTHKVIPDRIEAGTYAIAAAITGGQLLLKMDPKVGKKILTPVIKKLEDAGVQPTWKSEGLVIERSGKINPVSITAAPYPEFPTDLLPQWVSLMTQADGDGEPSTIKDTIYDDRFKCVPDLIKMGADIEKINERVYKVYGKKSLSGKHVVARDLRAGAALILAGLVADGSTVVKEFEQLLRGYENIEEKLKQCGANLKQLDQTRPGFYGCSLP